MVRIWTGAFSVVWRGKSRYDDEVGGVREASAEEGGGGGGGGGGAGKEWALKQIDKAKLSCKA